MGWQTDNQLKIYSSIMSYSGEETLLFFVYGGRSFEKNSQQ